MSLYYSLLIIKSYEKNRGNKLNNTSALLRVNC